MTFLHFIHTCWPERLWLFNRCQLSVLIKFLWWIIFFKQYKIETSVATFAIFVLQDDKWADLQGVSADLLWNIAKKVDIFSRVTPGDAQIYMRWPTCTCLLFGEELKLTPFFVCHRKISLGIVDKDENRCEKIYPKQCIQRLFYKPPTTYSRRCHALFWKCLIKEVKQNRSYRSLI